VSPSVNRASCVAVSSVLGPNVADPHQRAAAAPGVQFQACQTNGLALVAQPRAAQLTRVASQRSSLLRRLPRLRPHFCVLHLTDVDGVRGVVPLALHATHACTWTEVSSECTAFACMYRSQGVFFATALLPRLPARSSRTTPRPVARPTARRRWRPRRPGSAPSGRAASCCRHPCAGKRHAIRDVWPCMCAIQTPPGKPITAVVGAQDTLCMGRTIRR
jgi:hypothetical protein